MNENMYQNSYQNQGWNQQPGYPPNYGGPNPQNGSGSSVFAVVSLVLGILSIVLCCVYGGVFGIVGLVFGIISYAKREEKRGVAIGGIITSAIGIVMMIAIVLFQLLLIGSLTEYFWEVFEPETFAQQYLDKYGTAEEEEDSVFDTDIDSFAGKEYVVEDDSVIYFGEDQTFVWYLDDEEHEDNYYQGSYLTYRGVHARDVLVSEMTEYGVTDEELEEYFERNTGDDFYSEENFTLLILQREYAIVDGSVVEEDLYDRHYMGFLNDGYYDAVNMDSAEYVLFTER